MKDVYKELKERVYDVWKKEGLMTEKIEIRARALGTWEALGSPKHQDPPPGPGVNRFRGRIRKIEHRGGMAHVEVMVADAPVKAQMTTEQAHSLSLSTENSVYGILKLRALHGC